jgi:hypothetical protein
MELCQRMVFLVISITYDRETLPTVQPVTLLYGTYKILYTDNVTILENLGTL